MTQNEKSDRIICWAIVGVGQTRKIVIDHEKPLKSYIQSVSKETGSINLYIGPEGGFTTEEVELARNNHYIDVGLGSRILRAETAAISAITLLQFYFGDL